jgi:hypothetical protein
LAVCKIKLKDIAYMKTLELSQCLESSIEWVKYLHALAIFQTVPSIGPKVAERVVDLGNYPESDKCWFDFTEELKRYRQQFGYHDTRPKLAWHEVKN